MRSKIQTGRKNQNWKNDCWQKHITMSSTDKWWRNKMWKWKANDPDKVTTKCKALKMLLILLIKFSLIMAINGREWHQIKSNCIEMMMDQQCLPVNSVPWVERINSSNVMMIKWCCWSEKSRPFTAAPQKVKQYNEKPLENWSKNCSLCTKTLGI